MRYIFFLRTEIQFFLLNLDRDYRNHFSTLCKIFKVFPFILFEKRRLAQGIRRPKAATYPLQFYKRLKREILHENATLLKSYEWFFFFFFN